MPLQLDHGQLEDLAPSVFRRIHNNRRPKGLQIYDLEYKLDGGVFTMLGIRLRDKWIPAWRINGDETRALNRHLRSMRWPDPESVKPKPAEPKITEKEKRLVSVMLRCKLAEEGRPVRQVTIGDCYDAFMLAKGIYSPK